MMPVDVPRIHVQPDEITATLLEYANYVKTNGGERNLKLMKRKTSGYVAFNMVKPVTAPDWLVDATAVLPNTTMVRIDTLNDVVDAIYELSGIMKEMYEGAVRKVIDEVLGGVFVAILDKRPDGDAIWIGSSSIILLIHGDENDT